MTTFEKLSVRIKKDLGYDLVNFERTYAGIHQRGSGAFVWTAQCKGSLMQISSCTTATHLLLQKSPITKLPNSTISGLIELI